MSKGSKPDEESALSLAYRGLTELPRESIPKLAKVRHLDLSNNNFSDLRSLFGLSEMRALILDNNQITSHTVFPPLPKLKILWVNKNNISNLSVFMESVATNFPDLEQLCMMNNPAAPSYFNGGSRQEYLDYRQFVISHLFHLEYLDDSPVTAGEREAAGKIYGKRRPSALSSVGKTPSSQSRKRSATMPRQQNGHQQSLRED